MIDLLSLRSRSALAALGPPAAERPVDDAFFEAIVDAHYRKIYNLVARMVGNEADAADLTQEVFVRVYRALPRLRAEGAQAAWIRRIATNLCLDYLRRRRAAPATSSLDARVSEDTDALLSWDIPDPGAEPDQLFAGKERLAMLRRAIDTLPDDYRTVVMLHHIDELGVEDIARTLNVPAGTVKSRLSRARRELHRKLSPYFDPDLALG